MVAVAEEADDHDEEHDGEMPTLREVTRSRWVERIEIFPSSVRPTMADSTTASTAPEIGGSTKGCVPTNVGCYKEEVAKSKIEVKKSWSFAPT